MIKKPDLLGFFVYRGGVMFFIILEVSSFAHIWDAEKRNECRDNHDDHGKIKE